MGGYSIMSTQSREQNVTFTKLSTPIAFLLLSVLKELAPAYLLNLPVISLSI